MQPPQPASRGLGASIMRETVPALLRQESTPPINHPGWPATSHGPKKSRKGTRSITASYCLGRPDPGDDGGLNAPEATLLLLSRMAISARRAVHAPVFGAVGGMAAGSRAGAVLRTGLREGHPAGPGRGRLGVGSGRFMSRVALAPAAPPGAGAAGRCSPPGSKAPGAAIPRRAGAARP